MYYSGSILRRKVGVCKPTHAKGIRNGLLALEVGNSIMHVRARGLVHGLTDGANERALVVP